MLEKLRDSMKTFVLSRFISYVQRETIINEFIVCVHSGISFISVNINCNNICTYQTVLVLNNDNYVGQSRVHRRSRRKELDERKGRELIRQIERIRL